MFNAIAHSGVKIDARANINSTSDPISLIPTAFLSPEMSLLQERRGIISHFCLTLDLARLGRSVPQLIAGMSNLCPSDTLYLDCIASAKVSECSLMNLKRFVPLLLPNIKLSSVKLSCQDQCTQTFLKLPIYCKPQNRSLHYFFEVRYSAQDKRTFGW